MDPIARQQFQKIILLDEEEYALTGLAEAFQLEGQIFAKTFYEGLLADQDTAIFLVDKANDLQEIVARWITSLFSGESSKLFWEEQVDLGSQYARLGVPRAFLVAGFARLRNLLIEKVFATVPSPADTLQTLSKLLDTCQYLADSAYVREIEQRTVKSLRTLTHQFSPQTFFRESARLACQLVGADGAALILLEDNTLRYVFFEGLPDSYCELGNYRFATHEGSAGAALARGKPVYLADYPGSAYAMQDFVAAGLQSSLAIPLQGPDQSLGVLAISWFSNRAPKLIPEDQWNYLRLLSDMLSGILYRAQLEERLENLATRDILTGLPNRRSVADRISGAMARADRHHSLMALLFIDLDGFKPINDRLGHAVGDRTLKTVAENLRSAVRQGDTVARYAGDEFIVILEEAGYMAEIETILQRLLQAIRRDVADNNIVLSLSASIGVTVYPFDDSPPESLIHHADLAMYQAKKEGGGRWCLYEGNSADEPSHDSLLRELERAAVNQEFRLFWQPIVDLRSLRTTGAEALLRWQHPEKGLLAPAAFLDVLEESPLMRRVGHWVLETALRQAEQWHQSGLLWDVHINLAAIQLKEADFSNYLKRVLSGFPGLVRSAVWLEIVERVALDDVPAVAAMIQSCRALGVHFTLDDFGTGAAAIQYLVELECSGMKIDKSLITPMQTSGKHHTLVHTLVDMATSLSIKVVAEGIENVETADRLRDLGVTHAQGFYFSKPVPAEELPQSFKPN